MSSSDPKARPKPGPWPPVPESSPMPPSSWAKITGFRPKFSGETNASDSGQISTPPQPREPDNQPDLEVDQARAQPQPAAARAEPTVNGQAQGDKLPLPAPPATDKDQPTKRRRDSDGAVPKSSSPRANRRALDWPAEAPRRPSRSEEVADVLPQTADDDGFASRHSRMKYELRDNPGLVPISFFYGFQYFLSMLGSLVLVPLVIVPAMGGDHDIAAVVSTVLLVSGVTTFLQTCFGSRSPLIQDPSFVYLAPALAIINSPEFQGLNGNNFKQIMRELQGAIIVTSAFQAILGYSGLYFLAKSYSGLMSILLRLINPVVVTPTTCLRKISIFGHHIFLIYAVPLSLAISWAAAFLLTEAGAYSYTGCDWGTPVFRGKMAIVMCVVSLISSVDLIGSYHASSLLVASRPPAPSILSHGIGLEGLSSVLAGLWGIGTGSSTLTENVHSIAVTKIGSRRAVEVGAGFLIILSVIGKIGGFLALIPIVMVAALLCYMWVMLAALGLSNLCYSEAGSSRNIIIPYIVASHGPFRSEYGGVNYVMSTLLSMHMVIAFFVAVVLDDTVPGSKQEGGVYVWSEREAARRDPAVTKDYELPFRVSKFFRWVKWVGL